MYSFPYFKEQDPAKLKDFIRKNPFAFLTGSFKDGKQVVSQIPMLLKEENGKSVVQGHIMRKTDHHKAFLENPNVMAVFSGAHAYVSSSWYKEANIGSTWNYSSIQIAGQVRFLEDDELVDFMRRLTKAFEEKPEDSPVSFDKLPKNFLDKMLPAIVGIEINTDKMENVFKMSQNRDKESYLNIISKLKQKGAENALVAEQMEEKIDELFPEGEVWDPNRFHS